MHCLHSEIIKIKSASEGQTIAKKDPRDDKIEIKEEVLNASNSKGTRNRSKDGSRLSMRPSHDDKTSENQEISDSSGIFSQSPGSAAGNLAVVTGMDKPKMLSSK